MKFLKTNSGVTVFADKPYSFQSDHSDYDKVLEALRNDDLDSFMELVRKPEKKLEEMSVKTDGKVEISCGEVLYEGKVIHHVVCNRISDCIKDNLPVKPMVLFLENLLQNTSKNSVDQLYPFLEHNDIPITEDGCFLAYKRVDENWMDFHSRKYLNKVGQTIKMPRNQVNDNPADHCSHGFHAGSMKYVKDFANGGHVVVVKINPKDVVSVPSDHNCTKIRVCEYTVVDEYKGELLEPLYKATVNDVRPTEREQYHNCCDEYCDEYCDECGEHCDECDCDFEETCEECGLYENNCECD